MLLNEQQAGIRDMARDFARKEIAPYAAQWDRDEFVSLDTIAKMGQLGLMGVCVPEQWGGAGADFVSYVSAMEQIAYGDAGIANIMAANNSPVAAGVAAFGNDDQKERFLKPLATGRQIGAFLLSEPQAGSDAASIVTRALKRGETYVLNGTKNFITCGGTAGIAMIIAVTDPAAGKAGISCFMTETKTAGYIVARKEKN